MVADDFNTHKAHGATRPRSGSACGIASSSPTIAVYGTNLTGSLPNVMVSDLVYHDATHTLWAATYGRGIWRLPLTRAFQ